MAHLMKPKWDQKIPPNAELFCEGGVNKDACKNRAYHPKSPYFAFNGRSRFHSLYTSA
jgi:hypothetical protein